jgi:hypothetical protein
VNSLNGNSKVCYGDKADGKLERLAHRLTQAEKMEIGYLQAGIWTISIAGAARSCAMPGRRRFHGTSDEIHEKGWFY